MTLMETCSGAFVAVTKRDIKRMTRSELVRYLEARGVACYDDESTVTLRNCALVDLECERYNGAS